MKGKTPGVEHILKMCYLVQGREFVHLGDEGLKGKQWFSEATIMVSGVISERFQGAMFLAVQHDCSSMDKNTGSGPKSKEKREKMKWTLLKDWKACLSYFLQNSSTPGKPKTGKKRKQQTLIKPSPEEAQLWSEAFDDLLARKYGLATFRAFLKSEFCEENIEFWLACEDFKKTKSPQKLSSKARKIYTDFIEKEAPKQINIDFQTKTLIAQNIQEATSGCFTSAQKTVYSLMENNSYSCFLKSEFYQDLCQKPQITTEPHAT
ncbi:regulator of G-protein signaling 2-like [Choloepus didactylus]|uniref:regulator of G-protein signaling 2-like n=1 Tax=Choloepus didactylus TaxID=27675 RepID=UPI00189CF366|nr:regulator of G-protein signaling 2-like [Choloepus didactylus]